jgi:MoaA/NifB/PqqE/SkfB family radical SAM enzyme
MTDKNSELENLYFEKRKKQFDLNTNELKKIAPFPKNSLIELNNACNHACLFCKNPDQSRNATQLKIDTFEKFISEAAPLGLKEVGLYSTGEPFITKDIEKYIAIAKDYNIERIYLTTNGSLATLEKVKQCFYRGLNSIKFSINASNALDYLKIHGKDDFEKVLKNVQDIYNWKTKNNIQLQMLCSCVLIPKLEHTELLHKKIFSKYFEDTIYLKAHSQGGQSFQLQISNEFKSSVFKETFNSINTNKPCQFPWNRVHLTAEGYLTACCMDYDLDLVFGDIKKDSLINIWNNDTIQKLRDKHLKDKLTGLLCDQCMNNRPAPYEALMKVTKNLKSSQLRKIKLEKLIKRFKEI